METRRGCYLHQDTQHIDLLEFLLEYQDELLVLGHKVDFDFPTLADFPLIPSYKLRRDLTFHL